MPVSAAIGSFKIETEYDYRKFEISDENITVLSSLIWFCMKMFQIIIFSFLFCFIWISFAYFRVNENKPKGKVVAFMQSTSNHE